MSCHLGAVIERSCLMVNLVMLTRHIVGLLFPASSLVPLIPPSVMRHGACRRGRRRWIWNGPLQRNVIHDTIESLNDDAGLRWALSPVLARHIATRRFRRYPGRLLFGEKSGCSPRKALPGKRCFALFDVFHLVFELRIYHCRSGRYTTNWIDT